MVRVDARRYADPMIVTEGLVCVELKRCHGEPLVPGELVCQNRRNFSLTQYFQRVLTQEIPLHSKLHDRPLVPYQTFVPADKWRESWDALEVPLAEQRQAYKVLRRGKKGQKGPGLDFGVRPRFTEVDLASPSSN